MRRWFAILLLVLLPLQAVWAAVAPYCEHEESAAASTHLGHHEHEHQEVGTADNGKSALPDAGHTDCHVCHGSATVAGLASLESPTAFGPDHQALSQVPALPSPLLPRPERPNWSNLA